MAYPDAAPVMLMSEASLNDLSSRLDRGITVCQFRPSIVASDCEPFSEVGIHYFYLNCKWLVFKSSKIPHKTYYTNDFLHIQDSWDYVQIGQVEMQRVVGCGRYLYMLYNYINMYMQKCFFFSWTNYTYAHSFA